MRRYHTYLASDDRHFTEFVPELTAEGAYFGKTLGVDAFSFEECIRGGDEEFARYEAYAATDAPLPQTFFEREAGEHEELMQMISAMHEDRPAVFYANLPNNGAIANIPDCTVIERPTLFSGSGLQPMQLPDFPAYLLPPTMHFAAVYEVAVEAALHGDRRMLECAIEASTRPIGREAVHRMTEELLAAHKAYLPQFA